MELRVLYLGEDGKNTLRIEGILKTVLESVYL